MKTFDPAHLVRGDIILTTSHDFQSRFIRLFTRGEVSHAMLYVEHCSVIDAMPEGVHARNTQRMFFEDDLPIVVLRPSNGLTGDQTNAISSFARAQVGREYSKSEAMRTVIKGGEPFNRKQFCSRLVAQAYASAGISLVDQPNFCSPQDIKKSTLLNEVPNCLRPANVDEVEKWKNHPDKTQDMRNATNAFFATVRVLAPEVQDFNDLNAALVARPEIDLAINDALKASGYLEVWQGNYQLNPWQYHLNTMKEVPDHESIESYCRHTVKDALGLNRFAANAAAYRQLFNQHALQTFRTLTDLYVLLLDLDQQRTEVARQWLEWRDAAKGT